MELPTENQRIKDILNYYCKGNETMFSKEIGISQPRINRLFSLDPRNGKYPLVSFEIIQAIINKFININAEWLLTGKGCMLKKDGLPEIKKVFHQSKTKESSLHNTIPLYDLEATAGVFEVFKTDHTNIPIDHITIPNLPHCDGALYIRGDSMYPLLKSGDIVAYKITQDIYNIIWGEMYLIYISHNGDEYFFCKFLKKSSKEGYVELISHNPHHQTVEFPLESIKSLAMVKASIRFNTLL
ncbi:S24 family peptidase [Elizabethkingia argentiflava]|uniref:S24 family peptidase n=1 Tax=Elizabethkingia argenteiflava TaxID=2681556 RepID=A0A845PY31_9FLAO|nr:S24 family peptidase [Elizabethkingia argenteiflava]NAW52173.1 S24 family peptidase [Elizabethkingia argenteiflava]